MKILLKDGILGIWQKILGMIDNFKGIVIDGIQKMVITTVIRAGVATQEALAALDTTGDDASEGVRVSRAARVNVDALEEWVAAARGKELDEVMAEISSTMNDVNSAERRVMARDDSADRIQFKD